MGAKNKRFDVAVFPVPDAVLFPGVILPIHLSERRYVQMVQDVLARRWMLAVSLVVPYSETEYLLNTVCGVGEARIFREYPGGALDILVEGKRRAKLSSFVQEKPYIVMEAEGLEPERSRGVGDGGEVFEKLLQLIKSWMFLNPSPPDYVSRLLDTVKSAGGLSDFFAFHFIQNVQDKQVYLNAINPLKRADMLIRFLETDLIRLGRRVARQPKSALLH